MGEDEYLAEAAAHKILEAAVDPSLRATAVETVNGHADNMEEQLLSLKACVASVQTPPFLDPVKLTWWRGVTFLPGGGRNGAVAADVKAALEKFATDLAAHPLPSNQHLIITATKLLKTSLFAKALMKIAQVVEFASSAKSKDREEMATMRLADLAEAEKLKFTPGADQAFIAKVGTDTRTIVSELAKLRTYLGKERNEVTADDVSIISSPSGESPEFWDVIDALAQRNPAKLLTTLARLMTKRGTGIAIATVAEKFFHETYIYRDALDHKWLTPYGGWAKDLPAEVAEDLDAIGIGPTVCRSPWAAKNGAKNARLYTSLPELRAARFRMIRVREQLVSGADEGMLTQELLRVIAPPGARRRT